MATPISRRCSQRPVASRWRGWAAGVDELQQHLPPARPIELHQQHRLPTTDAKPAIHHRQAELVAEHHRNQVGVGIAGLIGRNALAQEQVVVEPGSFRRRKTEEEGLDVAQQPLLVFIEHQGRGGVLPNRHQQPLPHATALHQRLQVLGNDMAMERSSSLNLESLKEGGGDHYGLLASGKRRWRWPSQALRHPARAPNPGGSVAAASKGSLVSFSYEDVLRSLNISPAVLAENARFGSWWISNKPSLDESGNLALIPYGGKMLIFMSGGYV